MDDWGFKNPRLVGIGASQEEPILKIWVAIPKFLGSSSVEMLRKTLGNKPPKNEGQMPRTLHNAFLQSSKTFGQRPSCLIAIRNPGLI